MQTKIVKLPQIRVNGTNPRKIDEKAFEKLINSVLILPKMLELRPIVVDNSMIVLGGNMRYRALCAIAELDEADIRNRLDSLRDFQAKTQAEQDALVEYWLAWKDNPTVEIANASNLSEAEQREFIIKDNVSFGDWDFDALANEWDSEDLDDWGVDVWQEESLDKNDKSGGNTGALQVRFVVPPFSVLDTRNAHWQSRKKAWREFIGDTGESRNDSLIHSPEMKYRDLYTQTEKHRKELGVSFKEYLERYVSDEVKEREASKVNAAGVSLFDPVLAEVLCRWFTPCGGAKIFDCFAGDTQKGLVFGQCGFDFTGIELRAEQVEVNNRVLEGRNLPVRYICDDGQNVARHIAPESQDLLFSCPPYYDLEKYSDLENDASNQETYGDFIKILRNAFTAALGCLKENRFAVVVVGDIRDRKTGFYYDFCSDIKSIFKDNGVLLYNELILVEICGTAMIRAGRSMVNRKVTKLHQNVLVFYKGNPADIKGIFPTIDYSQEDLAIFDNSGSVELDDAEL